MVGESNPQLIIISFGEPVYHHFLNQHVMSDPWNCHDSVRHDEILTNSSEATTVWTIWTSNLWTKQVLFRKNFHYWGSSKDCQWHKNEKTIAVFTNKIIRRSGILITRHMAYKPAKGTKNTSLHTWHLKVPLDLIDDFHPSIIFCVVQYFLRTTFWVVKLSSFSVPPRWLSSPEVAPHRRDDAQHAKVTSAAGRLRRLTQGSFPSFFRTSSRPRTNQFLQVGCPFIPIDLSGLYKSTYIILSRVPISPLTYGWK